MNLVFMHEENNESRLSALEPTCMSITTCVYFTWGHYNVEIVSAFYIHKNSVFYEFSKMTRKTKFLYVLLLYSNVQCAAVGLQQSSTVFSQWSALEQSREANTSHDVGSEGEGVKEHVRHRGKGKKEKRMKISFDEVVGKVMQL